jgi:hypothetical protein
MSNLPVPVPGIVSRDEVDSMKRMMMAISAAEGPSTNSVPAHHNPVQGGHYSGGSAGQRRPIHESAAPVYSAGGLAGADDVDAMRTILERFHAASGTGTVYERDEPAPQQAAFLTEQRALPNGSAWEVNIRLLESNGKESKSYDVVESSNPRNKAAEGLALLEAAKAVSKFLNKGLTLESSKVQEVLELEETYNRNRIQANTARQRYARSTELGEASAAGVFKSQFETARAKALSSQDEIKSILESIR